MKKISVVLFLLVIACAHKESLEPEVGSDGAKSGAHGGVVYSIPVQKPLLKMKLVSLGLTKKNSLQLRIYFLKKANSGQAFLDPREQSILLPEAKEPIFATGVHANAKAKPLVQLMNAPKNLVELVFPLPSGGHHYPSLEFHWKIHFSQNGKDSVMERTEKYSAVDSYSQHAPNDYSADGDFPYEEPWLIPEGWIDPDMLWW